MKTRRKQKGGNKDLLAVQKDGMALEHVHKTEAVVLEAVKQNGLALQFAGEYQDNEWIVRHAIHENVDAFEYASSRLQDDKDFVIDILSRGASLEFVSERLKDDKEVVMVAVSILGNALYFASDRLRSDPDVTDAAIDQDPSSIHFVKPLPHKPFTRRFSATYSNQKGKPVCGYHAFSKVILKNVFELLHPLHETDVYVEQECNRYLDTSRYDLSDLTPEKCSPDGYLKILLFLHLYYLYLSSKKDYMVCGTESSIFPHLFEPTIPKLSFRHLLSLKETLDYMKLKKDALHLTFQYFRFEPNLDAIQLLTDAGLYVMLSAYYSPDKIGHALVIVGTDGNEILYKDSYGVEEVNRFVFGRRFRLRSHYFYARSCSLVIPVQGIHDTLKSAFANYLHLKKNIKQLLQREGFV